MEHTLNREACVSPKGVRSFLKLSRLATDDVLQQKLNNLLNHHESGFLSRKNPQAQCDQFIKEQIYPIWDARVKSIKFCGKEVAEMRAEIDETQLRIQHIKKTVDLRTNPYAAQDLQEELELKYADVIQLESWVKNEREIEKIIQQRSLGVFADICKMPWDLKKVRFD